MQDFDPIETQEWLDSLKSVLEKEGIRRVSYLINRINNLATQMGSQLPSVFNTPYRNTIPREKEVSIPGDLTIERRIRSLIRWNAMVMVMRANIKDADLGGHISSFASIATLYDVGFNHFFQGPNSENNGDLIYFQGHTSPGIYARALLEGRISKEQMDNFRQEVGENGLSSYPHPWLMPSFWQFPTVSMGLGPIQAIYQARFIKYLQAREYRNVKSSQKVWCFIGDGETDEPESLGALSLAGRENLDNLIFVINCNLQRLDGPVRGNGKIIQELEAIFQGAQWNVIKVIWGRAWDPLLAKDSEGYLQNRMDKVVDGEYQNYKAKDGKFVRENFFNTPELKSFISEMSDDEIWALNRGGHDPYKIYAAYHEAIHHRGSPTVILAKTIKGYGTGTGEAKNTAHNTKKVDINSLRLFRDRFSIPVSDIDIEKLPYIFLEEGSAEKNYLAQRRKDLGGHLPYRRSKSTSFNSPPLETFKAILNGSGEREISTTMVFVRFLSQLVKDKTLGHRVVPIIPDEARTFGMEGMFRQLGIYSTKGQSYDPVDKEQLMFYREDKKGQILEEGINEAGAMSSFIAAGTSYSTNNEPILPFYIFYSMFGFQRIGDLAWAAGDSRTRGFLIGGTAGRTTLNGEGLQHEDGHSHILAGTIPNCRSYDPSYGYELVVIIQDGIKRMMGAQQDIFYYITVMNEPYVQPSLPSGVEESIINGMYLLEEENSYKDKCIQLMGSGTIIREVRAAGKILREDFNIGCDIWSVTSFNELRREGLAIERINRFSPEIVPKLTYVEKCLVERKGPVIAATDYIKLFPEQIRPWIKDRTFKTLGTDGFGRSDTRKKLRHFFEVDRYFIVVTALEALFELGELESTVVSGAISKFKINPKKNNPLDC